MCHIYPSELNVEKANNNNNRLYTKLYGKRDHFNFHFANFPFLSSNIPSDPSYGVYILQLVSYYIMMILDIAINLQ